MKKGWNLKLPLEFVWKWLWEIQKIIIIQHEIQSRKSVESAAVSWEKCIITSSCWWISVQSFQHYKAMWVGNANDVTSYKLDTSKHLIKI